MAKPSRDTYINEIQYIGKLQKKSDSSLNSFRINNLSLKEFLRIFYKYLSSSLPKYFFYILKFNRNLKKLWKLKNTYKNKKVIIIGGGESLDNLNQENIDNLRDQGFHFITLNNYLEYVDLKIRPNHIVLSDPDSLKKYFPDIIGSFLKDTKIFLPCSKNIERNLNLNKDEKKSYQKQINFFIDTELRILGMPVSPLLPRNYTSMTAYKALSIALHLGYSEIYLIGIDNTYLRNTYVNEKNEILAYVTRSKTSRIEEYTFLAQKPFFNGMKSWLLDIYTLFSDLDLFYDTKKPNRIINLDIYSLIDNFPKKNIESLIK